MVVNKDTFIVTIHSPHHEQLQYPLIQMRNTFPTQSCLYKVRELYFKLCVENNSSYNKSSYIHLLIHFFPLNSTPSENHMMPMMSMMIKNFVGEVFPGLS